MKVLLNSLVVLANSHQQVVQSTDSVETKTQRLERLSKGFITFLEIVTALVADTLTLGLTIDLKTTLTSHEEKLKGKLITQYLEFHSMMLHHTLIITDLDLGRSKVALEAYQTIFELFVTLSRKLILLRNVSVLTSPPPLLLVVKEVEEWVHGKPPVPSHGTSQFSGPSVAPKGQRKKRQPPKSSASTTSNTPTNPKK